jgi:hypothetical protein
MSYVSGHGVPQDYVQAHMWFNLAGAKNSSPYFGAIEYRDIVARSMTQRRSPRPNA